MPVSKTDTYAKTLRGRWGALKRYRRDRAAAKAATAARDLREWEQECREFWDKVNRNDEISKAARLKHGW